MNFKNNALKYLCYTVCVLFTAPKLGLKLGPVPLYLIDVLIFLTIFHARKLPLLPYKIPYKQHVTFILIMVVVNEIINIGITKSVLQPIYLIIRYGLAYSLFFVVPKIVRTHEDVLKILKFGLFGAFVTSFLLITSSLPATRNISSIILSNSILTPNADALSSHLAESSESGIRGTSLIGVSILSGAFLNVIWPLLFLLFSYSKPKGLFKFIFYLTMIMVPVGVVMTYSRGAILALLLITIGITIFQGGKYRNILVSILSLLYISFNTIGWTSENFLFDRIQRRTEAVINNPYDDRRETERIMAYIEPFDHLIKNPRYLFLGEGFAIGKIRTTSYYNINRADHAIFNRADHAVFAKAYYAYGMITSFSIILLFLSLSIYTLKIIFKSSKYSHTFSGKTSRLLFVMLMGFSSWFTFGHAAVSQPRGTILMVFVFCLVVSQRSIYSSEIFHLQRHPKGIK